MVQFCCGCDCGEAGVVNVPKCSAKFGALASGAGVSGTVRLQRNGTLITPAYEGPAQPKLGDTPSHRAPAEMITARAEGACNGDWAPGPAKQDARYIRHADGASIVSSAAVDGGPDGSTTTISGTRTQSWSTTIEMSLGIADVLSLGLSFSSTFEESVSDTEAFEWAVPAGETGYVVFTGYLMCSFGKRALLYRLKRRLKYSNDIQVLEHAMARESKARSARHTDRPMGQ